MRQRLSSRPAFLAVPHGANSYGCDDQRHRSRDGDAGEPGLRRGAVVVSIAASVYAVRFGTVQHHTYVHVMAGVLWTGIDLFMSLVFGPVLGSLAVSERASVFERFTPKMTFLMPTLALVTIFGGITLAVRMGIFPDADPWVALFSTFAVIPALLLIGWQLDAYRDRRWQATFTIAVVAHAVSPPEFAITSPSIMLALVIVTVLTVLGFDVLMPGEARIYLEMTSADPDPMISRYGMRNAKLGAVQGLFQLAIIVVIVYVRWGWV